MDYASLPKWAQELLPILLLLAAIGVVVTRLPKANVQHSKAYLHRRFRNWFPVGMTYAFLYMGRYNLNACKNALGAAMTKEEYGAIFAAGTVTYGISFVINGPLTDKWGGRRTILIAALGSAAANVAMGAMLLGGVTGAGHSLVLGYSVLYAINMYFQSFGAVSIVKVNAPWFHVRERGTFGGIFGILISLGIYFAFDWSRLIAESLPLPYVFYIPAALLVVFAIWDFFAVKDTPGEAGFPDFDTEDASSGDDGPPLGVVEVAKRMLQSPAILIIGAVEFCSGFLRNAIMQTFPFFAKETGIAKTFVPSHWGMLLCVAGILGGVVAGVISDAVFASRRGPVASILYGGMLAGALLVFPLLGSPFLGWLMVAMSLCIIGVHGMLSGTASMDFGGKKNVGVAVGIIDGLVYLGTGLQALVLGGVLPKDGTPAAKDPHAWSSWPMAIAPAALVGLLLASRLWNARPARAPQRTS